ncbi:MAG: hypothetical protein ACSHXY_15290 [Alphaproteobacteria bacterium]
MFRIGKKKKTIKEDGTQAYSYLFQTSGFPVIDAIRAEIESQEQWDYVASASRALHCQITAAQKFGFFPPYTKEQKFLANLLRSKAAGQNISTYAWGLYADTLKTAQNHT